MTDLKTSFAGLTLRNPIIVSSSGLTNSADKNKKLAEAGAGAIVLKSLFEEQILIETDQMLNDASAYAEGTEYLQEYVRHHKLGEYLALIKDSKSICGEVPIIASINCYSDSEWIDFAKQIESAGADAIEINILALQTQIDYQYGSFEQRHIDILKHIKKTVSIPIIMKLGNNFTNPIVLIEQLYANGANAVVLFNRFYQPDIDINSMKHTAGPVLSHPNELSNALRWIGIASSAVSKMDFAASGGVHNPQDIVKTLLAGASAVEVCSVLYKKSDEEIRKMLTFLATWMSEKGFERISQVKGRLSRKDIRGANYFERTQFLKYFSSAK